MLVNKLKKVINWIIFSFIYIIIAVILDHVSVVYASKKKSEERRPVVNLVQLLNWSLFLDNHTAD